MQDCVTKRRRFVPRRRSPWTTIAMLMVTVALGLVSAGQAAAIIPSGLHATLAPEVVTYPEGAAITGALSVPGGRIALEELAAGATQWSPAGSVIAGADGAFRFEVAASVSTDLRLRYAGDGRHSPASLDLRLDVRPRVTTSFPRGIWLGRTVALRGAVAPAKPGGQVLIERRVDAVWLPLGAATLDGRSRFTLGWRPDEYGFCRLRARVAADAGHAEGASRSEVVTVNRPNRHGVPYRFAHYIVIVRHRFRLYYYEHGALVRAFDVALGRPGYRTPLGHFGIRAKRRPGGGALGSCVMYYRGSIAIHGTDQAHLLRRFPRAFSHGCARMYDREALWLYRRCPRGTPVHNLR